MKLLLARGGGLERLVNEPPPFGNRIWMKEGELTGFATVEVGKEV